VFFWSRGLVLANKIIVIGGPARAGKSTLAKAIADRHGLNLIAWDMLLMALHHGAPECGVNANNMGPGNRERTWPIWQAMLKHAPDLSRPLIAEGGPFLPSDYAKSEMLRGTGMTLCYLGFAQISPADKLRAVRMACADQPDWTSRLSDAELMKFLGHEIGYSRMCSAEIQSAQSTPWARRCHYFDTGTDFSAGLMAAEEWLKSLG
jgi:hypothetical protein